MIVSLNSRDRASGSPASYSIELDAAVPPKSTAVVTVLHADVPFCRTLFHSGNADFDVLVDDGAVAVSMETGEAYASASELVTALNTAFSGVVTWSLSGGALQALNASGGQLEANLSQSQAEILGFSSGALSLGAGESSAADGPPMTEPEDLLFVTIGDFVHVNRSDGQHACAVVRGPRGDDPARLWCTESSRAALSGPVRRLSVEFEDQYGDQYDFGAREHVMIVELS